MQATIDTIYQTFNSQLADLICRKVNYQDCCNDILQDVYIKVILNIDKIEKADNIKSYLLKVADNAVVALTKTYIRNIFLRKEKTFLKWPRKLGGQEN